MDAGSEQGVELRQSERLLDCGQSVHADGTHPLALLVFVIIPG